MGPRPPQIFSGGGGGGGAFKLQGASLDQISILKIIIFLMIFLSFLVYSYYVASLNDTNYQLNNRVRNVDIIYDHEAEHSISDVPKHSSNGGLNPSEFSPSPLVKSSEF